MFLNECCRVLGFLGGGILTLRLSENGEYRVYDPGMLFEAERYRGVGFWGAYDLGLASWFCFAGLSGPSCESVSSGLMDLRGSVGLHRVLYPALNSKALKRQSLEP